MMRWPAARQQYGGGRGAFRRRWRRLCRVNDETVVLKAERPWGRASNSVDVAAVEVRSYCFDGSVLPWPPQAAFLYTSPEGESVCFFIAITGVAASYSCSEFWFWRVWYYSSRQQLSNRPKISLSGACFCRAYPAVNRVDWKRMLVWGWY